MVSPASDYPGFDVGRSTPTGQTQVRKIVCREGAGPTPSAGARVSLVVEAWLRDGTAVHRPGSSARPFVCRTGTGELPPGLDIAVGSMRAGEQAVFLIPGTLTAGASGQADLVVRLDLLSFVPPLGPDTVLARDPLAAVGVCGDVVFCVAEGLFQPLLGQYAQVVRDLVEDAADIQTLAQRHGVEGEELELFNEFLEHLIEMRVLSVDGAR